MSIALPLQRPAYTTTKGVEYVDWLAQNEESLREWYRLTSEWAPEQHPADYADFIACQFDIQCELDAVVTDGLYELALQEADNDDEPWEETP